MMFILTEHCDVCDSNYHERVYRDSWTGLEMCLECLYDHPELIGGVTCSPQDEGDNLEQLVAEIRKDNE
jgi:hypothetical protein